MKKSKNHSVTSKADLIEKESKHVSRKSSIHRRSENVIYNENLRNQMLNDHDYELIKEIKDFILSAESKCKERVKDIPAEWSL